jgi:hypothetical protein
MSAREKDTSRAAAGTTQRASPRGVAAATPAGRSVPTESIDLQISDVLAAVRYPANKDHLVEVAQQAGASNELLAILDGLPEQDYADVDAVTRHISSNYGPGLGT